MDYQRFIEEQVKEIKGTVKNNIAINALSGGVDSSTVTLLGKRAIGDQLKTYFIDSGLMRENEPQQVVNTFKQLGVKVDLVDARKDFLNALKGLTDPEQKRQAVTDTFYARVFKNLVEKSGAKFLFHGTILTDIEETVAGIKRQHNILEQVGIDPQKKYGYQVIEPLKTLRKDGVRAVAQHLGLPDSIHKRIPFPGPALATRIVGEVTEEKLKIVRQATTIVEEELKDSGAFQYFAVLLQDRATGIRNNKREFGQIIVIRCINSTDARTATPTELSWSKLHRLTERILKIPDVNRVCYDLTPKPPATIEYV
jgi:GMP synthase (glutamine-hydrolysing)